MKHNNAHFYSVTLMAVIALFVMFDLANGQYNYNLYPAKAGSCPPPLPVNYCSRSCLMDDHCQGIGKCCPTSCGGTTCSRPVTTRNPNIGVKAGTCPARPTGKWVCTATCSTDADCPGVRKCCKNRCGAMACQKPEVAADEGMMADAPSNGVPDNINPYLVYTGDVY